MIARFRKIVNGLYRGGAPNPQDVVMLKDKFGIRKIVSLDEKTGEKINRVCKLLGIDHVKLYINDHKDLAKIFRHNLKHLLIDGGPTFLHCRHGKDRTGLVTALFQCKYLGVSPDKAIADAKALGFGVGVNPGTVKLYEKLIKHCKPSQDNNHASIVEQEREPISDNRDTFLDESRQDSFAPFLDHTKQAPIDSLYNYIMDQSPTRQNYERYRSINKHLDEGGTDKNVVPIVGEYNNDAGVSSFGPAANNGGFIYD